VRSKLRAAIDATAGFSVYEAADKRYSLAGC
jgi:hypothetical protein